MRTGITSNTDTFQIVNINVNSNNRYKANIPCYCKLCTQKHLDICFFLVAFWCHYPFLSFPGTPVCNLMRNALSSTVAYIFVLLITLMWHGFVDQSSMRNLTRSNLFWLLARTFWTEMGFSDLALSTLILSLRTLRVYFFPNFWSIANHSGQWQKKCPSSYFFQQRIGNITEGGWVGNFWRSTTPSWMQQFIEWVPNDGIFSSKCYIKLHLAAFISIQSGKWLTRDKW